jgi:DNA (cytosine-5)-methyltransferase 1
MIHLDLFSGIGGFSLAGDRVWGEDHHIHSFVEVDPFCQKVLNKHWAIVPIHGDIRSYKHNGTTIDLLTGGFPCQPFSQAGKRRGKEDDRYLWPEMLRVIQESKPTWIIGENVAGIVNLGLEQVLSDLESEGYEVQPIIIPACAVNAPHRRDRVWIIAHSANDGRNRHDQRSRVESKQSKNKEQAGNRWTGGIEGCDNLTTPDFGRIGQTEPKQQTERSEQYNCTITNSESGETQPSEQGRFHAEFSGKNRNVADPSNTGIKILRSERKNSIFRYTNRSWNENWREVATRLCRVDDGISRRLDRTKRLKALGNAIVPQVVVPIMESIKEINKIMEGK